MRWGLALLLGGALLGAVGGCESQEAAEARRHAELLAAGDEDAAEGLFGAEIDLYRRHADGEWRRDRDGVFEIRDESHVRARVTLRNVRPERTYAVHLVWVRPDGRELFRRYAELTRTLVSLPAGVALDSTGALPRAFVRRLERRFGEERGGEIAADLAAAPAGTVVVNLRRYLDAVDLGHEDLLVRVQDSDRLRAYSQFNISRERQREVGEYRLRVFLDRRLLREVPVTIRDGSDAS
jgi:hypothetical protein